MSKQNGTSGSPGRRTRRADKAAPQPDTPPAQDLQPGEPPSKQGFVTPIKSGNLHIPKNLTVWPIEKLKPYERNPRTHSTEQVAKIANSIREYGWTNPILVDGDAGIIAGHGRLEAARSLGITRVPVIELSHLTDAQRRAYIIADNRTALDADWDNDLLAGELKALDLEGFDLALTGFEPDELSRMLEDKSADGDEVPEAPEVPVTEPGDLWILGRHRLKCGDATSADDVAELLNGAVPFLCVTDPPYGVEYDPAWRNKAAAEGKLAYAPSRVGVVPNDDRADWSAAWALFPGDVIYSWHPAGATSLVHARALQESGFDIRMQIIWAKSNFPIGRGDYHVRHEPCWYAVRSGKAAHRTDDRTQTTLWEINLDRNVEGGHSTQKPLECMARPIRNHKAAEVYDPFMGSGTTLIAAERLDRVCFGMEIDPHYCDVIVLRWAKATGQEGVRERDGARMGAEGLVEVATNA